MWRDGGKSEQARLDALEAQEQARLAAIVQKELDNIEAKAKAKVDAEAKRKARDLPGGRRARKAPRKFE